VKIPVIIVGTVAALAMSHTALAGGDAAQGKVKSAICGVCHGADGNSVNGLWPKIAGQHEMYIVKQLKDFRAGTRKDLTMNGMAKPLTDTDIANLAAFFASQKQK
jgi:cytochrome c553